MKYIVSIEIVLITGFPISNLFILLGVLALLIIFVSKFLSMFTFCAFLIFVLSSELSYWVSTHFLFIVTLIFKVFCAKMSPSDAKEKFTPILADFFVTQK